MDWEELLRELERLAVRLEADVRYEHAAGRSGRCVLNGQWIIVVDAEYRTADRAKALAMMLADFDTEPHYLPDAVRELLDRNRRQQLALFPAAVGRPAPGGRPGL